MFLMEINIFKWFLKILYIICILILYHKYTRYIIFSETSFLSRSFRMFFELTSPIKIVYQRKRVFIKYSDEIINNCISLSL